MKKLRVITAAFFAMFLLISADTFAERVYHIEKQKVGGDGSGTYDRITQGTWHQFKSDFSVTITCENPGSNACLVVSWPPIAIIPDDIEGSALLDFQAFIAGHDLLFESGNPINEIVHHVYASSEGPIDLYFHSIVGTNGTMIYEMHTI
jgi:hypothetical protein